MTGQTLTGTIRRDLQLLAMFVLVTRIPFLLMPVQGDDLYYLYGAQHAQIDPGHPHQARYVFQGREVSMLGHPHPPANTWILAGLLALRGDVDEPLFHFVYAVFWLLAAIAMYALARRFVPDKALLAALLFAATPALWVAGSSFEADLPFLAFLLSGVALFVWQRPWLAAIPLALAGLTAYQAVAIIPILWLLRRAYLPACAPALGVIGYQVWERMASGVWPILASAGYMNEYGLQRLQAKLSNAAALTAHLAWLAGPLAVFEPHWALAAAAPAALLDWHPLFWISFALGVLVLWRAEGWLGWWIRIFFAAALVLFFAGSARYLLPIAAPVCLLAARRLDEQKLTYAIAAQMMLAGLIAMANYQHWQAYREFAQAHTKPDHRTWIHAEWGLRFYAESLGALPWKQGETLRAGDRVLTSQLGATPLTGSLTEVARQEIRPPLPIRLIGGKAGWSSVAFGLRPFALSTAPIDTVTVHAVVERAPTESFLAMPSPAADYQLLSGFYPLEENRYRWMGREASLLLKARPGPVEITVFRPDSAPASQLTIESDGREVLRAPLQPGLQTLQTPALAPTRDRSLILLRVDQSFTAPGDTRELGVIVQSIGVR